jgi:hypothetical protein
MGVGVATKKKTAAGVLSHPVRVQILTIANARPISASRFVEEVLGISLDETPHDYKRELSHVAYHFTALRDAGCIKVADLIQRRGTYERVYVGTVRAEFDEEQWSELDEDERAIITTVIWQGLVARTESARIAKTIDSRDDRTMAWTAGEFDEQGWADMAATIVRAYADCERVRLESKARLEETGKNGIPGTFAMLSFESPPPK